jgi:RNA polymerase sigma-70 factor (ECF subfamily)
VADVTPARRAAATDAAQAEALVARARSGDQLAFTAMVEDRLDRAFRTASAILGNEADARDVVQDSFVTAWQQLPRLRDTSRFDPWLNQIIRNRCRDVLRQRKRTREIDLAVVEQPAPDSTETVGDLQALDAAFESLNAEQRQLLVLHHLHHLRVEDLATQLGIPVGTAKWRLHAARQSLARALEEAHR